MKRDLSAARGISVVRGMMMACGLACGALGVATPALAQIPAPGQTEPVATYYGHRAVRVTVTTLRELMTVRSLADDILTCEAGDSAGLGTFDIRVSPTNFARLASSGIRYHVLLNDIQQNVDRIFADDAAIRAAGADAESWFVTYRSRAEIEAQMQQYATTYPGLATYSTIGTSVLNNPIRMLRITGPGSTAGRPAVFFNGCQHAREWVTPMATMYLADRLLETYATDARVKRIVDNVDIYIVPVVNPDGYDYTRTVNSQWRKNRRDNPGTTCDGVDLNRNWGFQWGFDNVGSSGNQCDETYRGTAGFSEPELAGLKTQLDTIAGQGRLKAHVDVHANAQMILSVWGFRTSPPPPDLPVMNTLGQLMQTGMASVRGTVYPYGQGSVILYLNNGNARDYSYGVNNALAWTIELDGVSFQPAVSEILPISRELWNAFLPLSEYFIPAIPACYANCDQSTTAPVLNAGDFTCFLDGFRAGLSLSAAAQVTSYSNCDQSTTAPVLNAGDFTCFLTKFRAGCP